MPFRRSGDIASIYGIKQRRKGHISPSLENPVTRRFVPGSWLTALLLLLLAAVAGPSSLQAAIETATDGMVVAPEFHAAEIGRETLRNGGNAVDAAIATAMALTVTYPQAAPLGGGGFLLYRDEEIQHHALDFREQAPRSLRAEMFLDTAGAVIDGLSTDSGLAVGVPGTVAGLYEAHRRWGQLPWRTLLQPAIERAEMGFLVTPFMKRSLLKSKDHLTQYPDSRQLLRLEIGQRIHQPQLAQTLRRIQNKGANGFYRGPVARAIIKTVRRHGGVMQLADLRRYKPIERTALRGDYRGFTVVTFPPPSSGGVAILQVLGMLEEQDLPLDTHHFAEACRRAYADRARWLGDPDAHPLPLPGLIDRAYLKDRAADIFPSRATASAAVTHGSPPAAPPGDADETLHLSVTDREGRAVAMTLTLNRFFGVGFMAANSGILLNNELDDFALLPGVPNLYGLIGGEANAVGGDRRPLSSMTPTIIEDGHQRPRLVLGSPGGPRIITAVLQVLLRVLDGSESIESAVTAQRIHHQWLPDQLQVETMTHEGAILEPAELDRLRSLGHEVVIKAIQFGNVNAIARDEEGRWVGAADPRRDSVARGH